MGRDGGLDRGRRGPRAFQEDWAPAFNGAANRQTATNVACATRECERVLRS
jgi:hypothetical protein